MVASDESVYLILSPEKDDPRPFSQQIGDSIGTFQNGLDFIGLVVLDCVLLTKNEAPEFFRLADALLVVDLFP